METSYHIRKAGADFHIWKSDRAAQESLFLISSMVLSHVASQPNMAAPAPVL